MKFKKLLATAGIAAVACSSAAAPAAADTNGRPDVVFLSGSDTTYEMMVELSSYYNRAFGCPTAVVTGTQPRDNRCINLDGTPFTNYTPEMLAGNPDHDVIVNYFPTGSGNGITQVSNQPPATGFIGVDVARSSRQRGTSDNTGLRFVAFAREALPWVAFNGQGLPTNLTQAQLVNIFTGCTVDGSGNPDPNTPNWINNWNEVGGPNRPITVYAAQSFSGTRPSFDAFLGVTGTPSTTSGSAKCIPAANKDGQGNDEHIIFENNANPIAAQGNQPSAIFYYSSGRFRENRERRVFQGSINTIAPTTTNIQNRSFPFGRFVYNVYRNTFSAANASQSAIDFAGVNTNGAPGFLCKTDGQSGIDPIFNIRYSQEVRRIIRSHGFAPLLEDATDASGAVPGRSACRVEVTN